MRKVISYERPDGIYVTFGGQTALNVGIALKDEFAGMGVKVRSSFILVALISHARHAPRLFQSEEGIVVDDVLCRCLVRPSTPSS